MSKELNTHLFNIILQEMIEYPDVDTGKFFGLDVLKVRGKTFAMIWKEGRIGVKVLNKKTNSMLASTVDASHWVTSGRTMAQWVLAPHEYNDDIVSLKKWLVLAYNDANTNNTH